MNQKPVIGIILDWQKNGTFSDFPHFALRTHYSDAIKLAGGLPFMIPYLENDLIDIYLEKIDGLLAPGGFYAMPNNWYIDKDFSPYEETPRFKFEFQILSKAIDLNKPILGICGGMQVIAGIMGCKLISNIKKFTNSKIDHFDLTKDHELEIVKGTILHKIINKNKIIVNSHHNETIIEVKNNVIISAKTKDGIIEAIELNNRDFIIALQSHPEMKCAKKEDLKKFNPDHLIFKEFIRKSYEINNK